MLLDINWIEIAVCIPICVTVCAAVDWARDAWRRRRGTRRLLIAAANSSDRDKARADYICDGIEDNVEIQAAVELLGARGGIVTLLAGNYNVRSDFWEKLLATVEVRGVGKDKTIVRDVTLDD